MASLVFLGTIIALLIIFISGVVKVIQRKSIASTFKIGALVVVSYTVLWSLFYFSSSYTTIPLGTAICFDDWCVTVTKIESPATLGNEANSIRAHGKFFVLYIKMINEAKGIVQKPSQPRVHIIDEKGTVYSFSAQGQQVLEKQIGKQLPIDSKLQLRQSLATQLVFDIPQDAKNGKVLIEEGPFITQFLFPENKEVFPLPSQ